MNIESSQPNGNSRFAAGDVSASVELEASALEQSVTRVLLIDEDENELLKMRSLLGASLHSSGSPRFQLSWTGDAATALEQVENCAYDAYLINDRLGEITGLELIRRAVAANCDAPLILLSEQDDPSMDAQAARIGATDYLVKAQLSATLLERTLRYALAGKANERQLRAAGAQNEKLLAAIEAANVGVALSEARDGDNFVTYVNAAFTQMTGYAPTDVIGKTLSLLGARETAPELIREVRDKISNGESGQGRALNFRSDGTTFWNEFYFTPIPVVPGERAGHVGFFRDVTARVEAEKAAADTLRNLEIAQALTHLGSWFYERYAPANLGLGEPPFFSWWSDECCRILGLNPQADLEEDEWMNLIHPDDRAAVLAQFARARSQSEPVDSKCRLLREDGEIRHIQLRVHCEREVSAKVEYRFVGTILDVTARTRAERAERELEMRLRTVTESAPVILWALDSQGIFTLSEGHILERLGRKPGEAVGQSAFDIYAGNPALIELCQRALSGEVCEEMAHLNERTFAVYMAPEWNEQGEQTGVMGLSHDITEQRLAQQALRESAARFERIIANVPGMVYQLVQKPDGERHFDYVSEAVQELYGVTPAQALRDADLLLGAVAAEDKAEFARSVEQSAREGSDWQMELTIIHLSGERRFVRGQARPIRRADGSVLWDGILMDLSARKAADEALLQSQNALDQAQKLAHIGSFTWDLRTGEARWSNEMYRMFEIEVGAPVPDPEDVIARYHPDDQQILLESMRERLLGNGTGANVVRLLRRDGTVRFLETRTILQYDEAGAPLIMTGSLQDITTRIESERALRESEERYALAARGTNDGLWNWNLVTGEIYFSSHWKAMLGYGESEIGSEPEEWFSRVHVEDLPRLKARINAHLNGEESQCDCEYRLRNSIGEYRWMLGRGLALFNEDGVAVRLSGSQTDITERKLAENQLEHNAFYDTALTNLPNRALFAERLDRTIARANRHPEQTFAVLFMDIDHFKKINDSLGHLAGDRLLIEASARFQTCLRPGDTVARFGGDEFAILLDDIGSVDDVHQIADRIHAELEAPFALDGHEAFVTVSMGIAMGQGNAATAEELLRSADTAMYRAKGAGRGRHEIFEATMHARAIKMLEMETDLWRALERNELRLHYQPIIELENGAISGMEALVRWEHPQRGLVSPGDFIPLAEETGLIVPIGWWVLQEACRQGAAWQTEFGDLRMSVNLSPKQLSQPDMFSRVQGALERSGFDPEMLRLEVTETVIMESDHTSIEMFLSLKQLGIKFALDDFGTGYSSLSYLHRFPLDTLKIDRSFISHMKPGGRDHEIVNTIISMARGLKMRVVAEGVESPDQLVYLREMGCGYAQGFWMSKPQESEQIETLLRRDLRW